MSELDDNSIMPFGKYKGKKLANVPGSYLLYIYENFDNLSYDLKSYIMHNYNQIQDEAKKEKEQWQSNKK